MRQSKQSSKTKSTKAISVNLIQKMASIRSNTKMETEKKELKKKSVDCLRNRTKQYGNKPYQLLYLKEHKPSTVKQKRECQYDQIFQMDTANQ
jgi:hypothetical protein